MTAPILTPKTLGRLLAGNPEGTARQIVELCRRFEVHELAVFGSMARGEAGAESDIDLLVEFEPTAKIGMLAMSRLQRELSAVLGRPVDLVSKRGLKKAIRDEVLAEAEVLFAA